MKKINNYNTKVTNETKLVQIEYIHSVITIPKRSWQNFLRNQIIFQSLISYKIAFFFKKWNNFTFTLRKSLVKIVSFNYVLNFDISRVFTLGMQFLYISHD